MIFLLNREYVVWETVELARLHICEVLRLSTGQVKATIDLAGDKLSPEFLVDLDACEGITPDEIKEVMRHAYNDCKEEATTRLKGITQTREQTLQWLRGGTRWVLKSPQHLEQIDAIARVFPDATLVVTHRDPVSTVASFSTMISYATRLSAAKPDPIGLGHYWADRLERMLRRCVEDRDAMAADRSVDLLFHEYMGNELASVEQIYELAGVPFDAESKDAIATYQTDHPRGRFVRVRYDLADFELDARELRERFRFYTDRFPVRLES